MLNEKPVKRFIAGAVCPSCNKMDGVRVYAEDGKQKRECVYCDYRDEIDLEPISELKTRVNQPRPFNPKPANSNTANQAVQVLKFYPRKKSSEDESATDSEH